MSQPVKLFPEKRFGGDAAKPEDGQIIGVIWWFWRERNRRERSVLPVRWFLRGRLQLNRRTVGFGMGSMSQVQLYHFPNIIIFSKLPGH